MKIKTFLLLVALILLSSACKNEKAGEAAYYAALDRLTPEQKMSGRKVRLLYGNVKTVTRSDGHLLEFNEDGNPVRTKADADSDVKEYRYVNPKRYFLKGDPYPYNIIFDGNTRTEEWDNEEKLSTGYVFDEKGRLKEYGIHDYYSASESYHYKDNALLPFKIVCLFGDESGESETTLLYTYTKTDEKGNWLECKIKKTSVNKESGYDEKKGEETTVTTEQPVEYISYSRTIEYFPDDDSENAPNVSSKTEAFKWPPKKYPCNVPFKILKKGGRELPWNIASITCTGQAKDKSGYTFTLKGTGATDTRKYGMGSRTISFVPEEKDSQTIKTDMAAAYIFPEANTGEDFEFEFKGLFPGYYNEDLFVGFLILGN
ncbi:MAG: hypothetical protein LBK58_00085 [Prevotellaceae bacterium]|jgi:hypothetical protein|nr:hypothetical protein [Prevotellaceae bacterium]